MSNEIKIGLAVIAIAFIVGWLVAHVEENYQPTSRLVQEHAQASADQDHDGVISRREWMAVYRRIGVPFNEDRPEPLNTWHLRQYLLSFSKQ